MVARVVHARARASLAVFPGFCSRVGFAAMGASNALDELDCSANVLHAERSLETDGFCVHLLDDCDVFWDTRRAAVGHMRQIQNLLF